MNNERAGQPDRFVDAVRVQESLLAPLERRLLIWLARRMPEWVTPDLLTAVGFAAMLMAGVSYGLARWWPPALLLVNVWLALNWFGDSLDGTVARVRNKQRPRYGFYVDHVIDTVGALAVMGGLAFSGYMTPLVALGLLSAFYILSINTYLAAYSLRVFRLSFWKFSPTEVRVLLAVGNAFALDRPVVRVPGGRYLLFDVSGVIAITVMLIIFVIAALRNTVTLYKSERV
jgi:phosphatidylglycerophosphate synthase